MNTSKRIAKNTLMLYFRQILIMLVSLYTVRVVLNVLGAEDYGIYNVVAGVVVLFSFVNNAMASSTQRFLNFFIGKNDENQLKEAFTTSIIIHFCIAILFTIIAETVGIWFVDVKLNIPMERHHIALLVYQFTIISTVFNIIRVPYNAVIIAYEHMSFFAYISILEAILKLGIVFLLNLSNYDKLGVYGFLLAIISFIVYLVYNIFCKFKYRITHYTKINNLTLVKDMISFSGWSLFGSIANVCNSQGTNVVLNLFTNVTVNAAMGIANQVNTAVYSFVGNFQTAFNPQIVKLYASEQKEQLYKLIYSTSKISFFLLYVIVLPLYWNAPFVLKIWLSNVPDYSVTFVRLILIWSLIDSINGPLWISVQATGRIRFYQLIVSLLIFINLPLSFLLMKMGLLPEIILYLRIILNVITTFWRVFYLQKLIKISGRDFIKKVILRCLYVFIPSFFIIKIIYSHLSGLSQFFITCIFSVIINCIFIFFIGFNSKEKKIILDKIKGKD